MSDEAGELERFQEMLGGGSKSPDQQMQPTSPAVPSEYDIAQLEADIASSMRLNQQLKEIEAGLEQGDDEAEEVAAQLAASPRVTSGSSRASRKPFKQWKPGQNANTGPHTRVREAKIQRDNISLLSNLERIQRRGGGIDNRSRQPANHRAAAAVNRRKKTQNTMNENLAFLKRLQSVKPTITTKGSPHTRNVRGPRARASPGTHGGARAAPKKQKARPEWKDISVTADSRAPVGGFGGGY